MTGEDPKLFEYIFNPSSVAVIGASENDAAAQALLKTKIRDRLFLVNPNYSEVRGKRCYRSILGVENQIDYAVLRVAAAVVPRAIEECIQKGVKVAQIYTAGFSETGIPERVEMERKIREMARGKIRLIGPNCLGVYCPRSGQSIAAESSEEEGGVGVVSQSGSVAESLSYFGKTKNLKFSKVVSYGNAIDLDAPDFLEYLADDPETKIIALYIEGPKDAPRLKAALNKAAGRKPVIAIKGGMTEQGMRAASSHTGSMAATPETWRALFKQAGALQAESFEEMVNTLMAFVHSPIPRGNTLSIITSSGGFSVIQTDLCLRAGMEVPRFTEETLDSLRRLVPIAGTSIGNPIDAWPVFSRVSGSGNLADVIQVVAEDRNIHSLVFHFDQFRYLRRGLGSKIGAHMKVLIDLIIKGCRYAREVIGKPVMICVVLDPHHDDEEERKYSLMIQRALVENGFPVYSNLDATIRALANLYRFNARLGRE